VHQFWNHIIAPVLDAMHATKLVEIGVDKGETTRLLLERAREVGGVVNAVDPAPAIDVSAWEARYGRGFCFYRGLSLEALPRVGAVDAVLIDGDHNWYTVTAELTLVASIARTHDTLPPVVFAHDVGWPYGRRDMYYDPAVIPSEGRRDPVREGMQPGESRTVPWGFNYWLWNAHYEGGPRNGVLTAVEDFVEAESAVWDVVVVPGFHGLAVLAARSRLDGANGLREAFAHLRSHKFACIWAEVLERARIRAEMETWRLMGSPEG
jgi:hypothetical protein